MILDVVDYPTCINLASAVNQGHPLNRGRIAWWLCVSGLMGGMNMYDLCFNRHPGTLTSMGNVNNGWRGTSRFGGVGHIITDGTAGLINMANTASFADNLTSMTVAIWAKWTSTGGMAIFNKYSASDAAGWSIVQLTGGLLYAGIDGTTASNTWHYTHGAANAYSDGQWHRIVLRITSLTVTDLFVDGKIDPNNILDSSGTVTSYSNTGNIQIGHDYSHGLFGAISWDDACIWNRPLSTQEIQYDYVVSKLGYAGANVINYVVKPKVNKAASAAINNDKGRFILVF